MYIQTPTGNAKTECKIIARPEAPPAAILLGIRNITKPREGTIAWKYFEDNVPRIVKTRRMAYILNLQKEINRKLNEKYLGKEVEVIVESEGKTGYFYGRDIRNKIIAFKASPDLIGKKVIVKVNKITAGPLYGEIIK